MDEKLRIEIDYILAEVANHSNRYPDEDDAAHAIEQAFRDAGYRQLPSEKELALWLVGHLEYTSSELAKKLLGKLKGE